MGEGLRIVAELLAGRGIGFLGIEPERPGDPDQLLHEPGGVVDGTGGGEGLDEPERAWQESAFAAAESVIASGVAVDERPAGGKLPAQRVDGAGDERRVDGLQAEQRQHEQGGVKIAPAVGPHEGLSLVVDAVGGDVGADGVTFGCPTRPPRGRSTVAASRVRNSRLATVCMSRPCITPSPAR